MSDFAPSLGAGQQAVPNVPIVTRQHPTGAAGAHASMLECAMRIRSGRLDQRVNSWAIRALHEAGDPQGTVPQAQAILNKLRKDAIYVSDPIGAEVIRAAHETLCLDDKGLCFKGGDCIPEGTLLLRNDMKLIPIEEIGVGERIWGKNDWTTIAATCSKGRLHVDHVDLSNGAVLRLTSHHKVYVKPRNSVEHVRIRVSELQADDLLLQPDNPPEIDVIVHARDEELRVVKINRMYEEVACWDIQTSDHYVYLPEYDVTVSNCDDLLVAYGSATMSIGIPTYVVGQSFDQTGVITHVLAGIQDKDGNKYHVDPSSKMDVGGFVPATREEWIDPMMPVSNMDTTAGGGEFVGVGQLPGNPYQLITDNQIVTGGRYRIGLIVSFLSTGLGTSQGVALDRGAIQNALGVDNWTVESLDPNGDVTGGIQSWILQGVAKKDFTLANTNAISYAVVAVQTYDSGGGGSSFGGEPVVASANSTMLIVSGLALGAIGGLVWGMMQRGHHVMANPYFERTGFYRGFKIRTEQLSDGSWVAWTVKRHFPTSDVWPSRITASTRSSAVNGVKAAINKTITRYEKEHGIL